MKIKVIVSLFISLRAVWADVAIHQDSEQLVFQEVDHPDSSEAISPRRALAHDFDDENPVDALNGGNRHRQLMQDIQHSELIKEALRQVRSSIFPQEIPV